MGEKFKQYTIGQKHQIDDTHAAIEFSATSEDNIVSTNKTNLLKVGNQWWILSF